MLSLTMPTTQVNAYYAHILCLLCPQQAKVVYKPVHCSDESGKMVQCSALKKDAVTANVV